MVSRALSSRKWSTTRFASNIWTGRQIAFDRQYANNMTKVRCRALKHPVNILTNDEDGRDTTLTARPNI